MKNRFLSINTLLFFLISIQFAWYGLLIFQMVANPSILKNTLYSDIYPAGYIARYQGFSQVYNFQLQKDVETALIYPIPLKGFYPYNHPPLLLPIMEAVTTDNFIASYYRWISVLFIFHLLTLLIIALILITMGWRRKEVWLVMIAGLLFYPIFLAYLRGEDSVFELFGISLWTYGLLVKKDKLAGLGLVLAAMRPQLVLVLALPFLFKRRKVWWWFVGGGIIILLYSYILIGKQGIKDFFQALFYTGEGMGINLDKMPTFMGTILRTFPTISINGLHTIGYSAYILAILFLCFVWWKSDEIKFNHISLAVLLSILFSPHLQVHDLSFLLIPVIGLGVILVENLMVSPPKAVLLILGISVALAIAGAFQSFTIMFLMVILLGQLLWFPGWWKALQGGK